MFHPLFNLLITLVLIVLLIRKKVPLGYVMSAAGILLGLLLKSRFRINYKQLNGQLSVRSFYNWESP